ncbi:MAG: PHP domain-containing protein [Oscillospiraceae bacterium]|nr:PHP domain-containing protein [Oscillospiraceae bacterium]
MSLQKKSQPYYYDLHIHTALSPCANDDMTPNDIVGMAILNGLDLIAITDHNTIENAKAVIKAAENAQAAYGKNLIVLPGIEVSTAEEVHVLCLFDAIEKAEEFEAELSCFYNNIANRESIFGAQLIFDESDQNTGKIDRMLTAPTTISFDHLHQLTKKHGGAFVPAHIDRESFSVTSNLGFLPPHLDIATIELKSKNEDDNYPDKNILHSSDAHQLWSINEKKHFLMLCELTPKSVIELIK